MQFELGSWNVRVYFIPFWNTSNMRISNEEEERPVNNDTVFRDEREGGVSRLINVKSQV